MADMNDVRDELFRVSQEALGRSLTQRERDRLIEAFNRQEGSIYARCLAAVQEVWEIDLRSPQLILEKAASVDRVMNALANLRQVAQAASKK